MCGADHVSWFCHTLYLARKLRLGEITREQGKPINVDVSRFGRARGSRSLIFDETSGCRGPPR